MATRNGFLAGRDRCVAVSAGRHQRGRASIVTINQSTPENGAALVAVTIRTDTMQMSPRHLQTSCPVSNSGQCCAAAISFKRQLAS